MMTTDKIAMAINKESRRRNTLIQLYGVVLHGGQAKLKPFGDDMYTVMLLRPGDEIWWFGGMLCPSAVWE